MCRRLPYTRRTGPRPARRAEVALLFLAQEGRDTHAGTDCGRRVEQRWPYYFSWRRLADAEDAEDAEEGRKDARQKSNNPNTEVREKPMLGRLKN